MFIPFAEYEKMTRRILQSESVKRTLERKKRGEPDDNAELHELARKLRREVHADKPEVRFGGQD